MSSSSSVGVGGSKMSSSVTDGDADSKEVGVGQKVGAVFRDRRFNVNVADLWPSGANQPRLAFAI